MMKNTDIKDPIFLQAVEAIDKGDIQLLQKLLEENPALVQNPLDYPEGHYFKNPYLLWFVADNPIRNEKLPSNIVDITRLLIKHVKEKAADSMHHQLDYALGLVATGRIPRECGVQMEMIDLLIDEGAHAGGGLGALAHGNIAAAERLIERGGEFTIGTAVGLNRTADAERLLLSAREEEKLIALTVAAFYANASMLDLLLKVGVNPNGYPEENSGFHTHATPLHQAVYSGNLQAVKLLVEAGASLTATDKVYNGTPLGWAMYMQNEEAPDDETKKRFKEIEEYLKERQ